MTRDAALAGGAFYDEGAEIMKQYQFVYTGLDALDERLDGIRRDCSDATQVLFQVQCDCWAEEEAAAIAQRVGEKFPGCVFAGTASWGNILDGQITVGNVEVICQVFESPSAKVEALYLPLEQHQVADAVREVTKAVRERPWVKAVELLAMVNGEAANEFCAEIGQLPADIQVFGGESHYAHGENPPRFVLDGQGKAIRYGMLAVFFGGDELHVMTRHVKGWKPLGYEMVATKFQDNLLAEINGRPAHELYYKYLQIENDADFFTNALEFPLLFNVGGATVLRTPAACLPDGSIVLAAAVPEAGTVRISYGDPAEILAAVKEAGDEVAAFRPDGIMLYSCGARRTFWTDERCSHETLPFAALAPTAGYYTATELCRDGAVMSKHNSTLVVAAFREGDVREKPAVSFHLSSERNDMKKTLVARFAYFVDVSMNELAKANTDLENANRALEQLSITDGLTGLLNRAEIERLTREACANDERPPVFMMIDLDDFKAVNDTFGHHAGDVVLKQFADLLTQAAAGLGKRAYVGRWGGEEFMMLLRESSIDEAVELAEAMRAGYEGAAVEQPERHTASFGIAILDGDEGSEAAINRADKALYVAKQNGKNRVVAL